MDLAHLSVLWASDSERGWYGSQKWVTVKEERGNEGEKVLSVYDVIW